MADLNKSIQSTSSTHSSTDVNTLMDTVGDGSVAPLPLQSPPPARYIPSDTPQKQTGSSSKTESSDNVDPFASSPLFQKDANKGTGTVLSGPHLVGTQDLGASFQSSKGESTIRLTRAFSAQMAKRAADAKKRANNTASRCGGRLPGRPEPQIFKATPCPTATNPITAKYRETVPRIPLENPGVAGFGELVRVIGRYIHLYPGEISELEMDALDIYLQTLCFIKSNAPLPCDSLGMTSTVTSVQNHFARSATVDTLCTLFPVTGAHQNGNSSIPSLADAFALVNWVALQQNLPMGATDPPLYTLSFLRRKSDPRLELHTWLYKCYYNIQQINSSELCAMLTAATKAPGVSARFTPERCAQWSPRPCLADGSFVMAEASCRAYSAITPYLVHPNKYRLLQSMLTRALAKHQKTRSRVQ